MPFLSSIRTSSITGTSADVTASIANDSSNVKNILGKLKVLNVINSLSSCDMGGNTRLDGLEKLLGDTSLTLEGAIALQKAARELKQNLRENLQSIRNHAQRNQGRVLEGSVTSNQIKGAKDAYLLAKSIQHNYTELHGKINPNLFLESYFTR